MPINTYEEQLTGGHPNSLGNTIAVVDDILQDKKRLQDLYDCYKSTDAVVRLRVSNALKRICKVHPEWVALYLDGLTTEIASINQPSTKWTLATLFMLLDSHMTAAQRKRALEVMKNNLETEPDWIVQNTTAESLAYFAGKDESLRKWLIPQLSKQLDSLHKSVARRAQKLLDRLDAT